MADEKFEKEQKTEETVSSTVNYDAWKFEYSGSGDGTVAIVGYRGEDAENVIIPATDGNGRVVSGVRSSAFYIPVFDNKCRQIKTVKFEEPSKITSVGWMAFTCCRNLTAITIPDSVTHIGEGAFALCESLTSIKIPDGVTHIEDCAFSGCRNLTSITIPSGVTCIGKGAFSSCSRLTSITIPDSVKIIEEFAFSGCTGLSGITVDNKNTDYVSCCGALFNKKMTRLLSYPAGKKETSYTIPDTVTSIGGGAFENCKGLESITVPDGVTYIGEYAFYGCENLTSLKIPKGVMRIGKQAFKDCNGLTVIEFEGTTKKWTEIGGFVPAPCVVRCADGMLMNFIN